MVEYKHARINTAEKLNDIKKMPFCIQSSPAEFLSVFFHHAANCPAGHISCMARGTMVEAAAYFGFRKIVMVTIVLYIFIVNIKKKKN